MRRGFERRAKRGKGEDTFLYPKRTFIAELVSDPKMRVDGLVRTEGPSSGA